MKLHELRESRAKKVSELRSLNDAANGSELSGEARSRFDTLETEVRALDEKISRETRIAEYERTAAATPINDNGTRDFDREVRNFSLIRAAAYLAQIPGVDAAREIEVGQELQRRTGITPKGILIPEAIFRKPMERRVVLAGTSGAGVIPSELHSEETVEFLYNRLVTKALGARVLAGLQGNVTIPSVDTGSTAQWVAENGALSAADFDLNSKTASPKHVGALMEVSRNMLQQSSPDIEALFRSDTAANLAAAIDSAALVGGGSNQPSGIGDTLVDATDTSTFATPTWAEGLAMVYDIDANNALGGSLGWAMHPQCAKKLRSTVRVASSDSRFIMDDANTLYDYPALTTAALTGNGSPADRGIIVGNFADLLIATWSAIDFLANPFESTAFTKGNVQFRSMATVDVVVRRNKSFRYARDMNTV